MRSGLILYILGYNNTLYRTGGEHWGKVVVTINDNQLVLDPRHQKKARQLSSFLKGVPMEMVNQCGHAFSLIVIV